MADSVGSLSILLGINSQAMEQGLSRAKGYLDSFAGKVQSFSSMIGPGLALPTTIGGVTSALMDAGKQAVAMSKMGERLGLSTESMGTYMIASKGDLEGFETGLSHMYRTLAEARLGGENAERTFRQLGTSSAELAHMAADEALHKLADGYKALESPAMKAAVAHEAFGRNAGAMREALKGGAAGLDEAASKAREYGLAVDAASAKQFQQGQAAMKDVGLRYEGLKMRGAMYAAPLMGGLGRDIDTMLKGSWGNRLNLLAGHLTGQATIGRLMEKAPEAPGEDQAKKALELTQALQARATAMEQAMATPIEKAFDRLKQLQALRDEGALGGNKYEQLRGREIDSMFGADQGQAAMEKYDAMVKLLSRESDLQKGSAAWQAWQQRLKAVGDTITGNVDTPLEKLADKLRELDRQLDHGTISAERYGRALKGELGDVEDPLQKFQGGIDRIKTIQEKMNVVNPGGGNMLAGRAMLKLLEENDKNPMPERWQNAESMERGSAAAALAVANYHVDQPKGESIQEKMRRVLEDLEKEAEQQKNAALDAVKLLEKIEQKLPAFQLGGM